MSGGIGNPFEIDLNVSNTIASLTLSGSGRLALKSVNGNNLTVTNPIVVGANQEMYTFNTQQPLVAPISLTGGFIGYPLSPYPMADTGAITATSGTSTLNFVTRSRLPAAVRSRVR